MADGRDESYGGRRVGVGGGDVDVKEPCAAWGMSVFGSLRIVMLAG
jgi:hypothetical protein